MLVPVTGFYEWTAPSDGGGKVPHSIRVRGVAVDPELGTRLDRPATQEDVVEPFLLAGIVDPRSGRYAVLTTEANERALIHDRMPVILDGAGATAWLEAPPEDTEDVIAAFARPFDPDRMEAWPVGRAVNAATADGPSSFANNLPEHLQQSLL